MEMRKEIEMEATLDYKFKRQVVVSTPQKLLCLTILLIAFYCSISYSNAQVQQQAFNYLPSQEKLSEISRSQHQQQEHNSETDRRMVVKRDASNQAGDSSEEPDSSDANDEPSYEPNSPNSSGAADESGSSASLAPDYSTDSDPNPEEPASTYAPPANTRIESSNQRLVPSIRPPSPTTMRTSLQRSNPTPIRTLRPVGVSMMPQTSTVPSVRRAIEQPESVTARNFPAELDNQRAPSTLPTVARLQDPGLGSTFNLNMGADRMLIKPSHQQRATNSMSTLAGILDQEMATESVNHELLSNQNGALTQNLSSNERRADLLYPSKVDESNLRHLITSFASRAPEQQQQQQDQSQSSAVPSICYTPIALLMVILVTMMITVVVCFCTHVLIRYLSRHQFDLIESSKQFDTKHGSSSNLQGAVGDRRTIMSSASNSLFGANSSQQAEDKQICMLSLFQSEQALASNNPDNKAMQRLRDEHGFAFDNPYFRDEPLTSGQRYLRQQQQQQQQQQYQQHQQHLQQQHQQQQGLLARKEPQQPVDSEQLHFIEHHISNLHARQVTSSVKELSILGSPETQSPHVTQVVDLTSDEQRSKVISDPKEGDLVAVDISGHDIIGLGFDICGNQSEGIFIKSVLARGPARESGCIQQGDRIKCLNISFENMTLQDACDILNCGSPYKMRLLLEKRLVSNKLARQIGSAQPTRSDQSGAPMNTTRTYIKRLTNLMQGKPERQTGKQTPAFHSSGQQLIEPAYLGSLAARRRLSSSSSLFQENGAHSNPGYGSDLDVDTTAEADEALARHRHISRSDSNGSNMARNRFLNDSAQDFGSSANDLATDSSLDYHNQNANHRLHGPPLFTDSIHGQGGQKRDLDLRLTASSQPQLESKLNGAGVRRQSATAASTMSHANHQSHLEQTQSQPEIALVGTGNESNKLESVSGVGANNTRAMDEPARNARAPMTSSLSSPSVNLLSSNAQPQLQQQQQQVVTNWRLSSQRRKKEHKGEIIREEANSSDNSFTDSTSKLVERKESSAGRVGTQTNVNNPLPTPSSENNNSALISSRSTGALVARLESRINGSSKVGDTFVRDTNNKFDNTEHIVEHRTKLTRRTESFSAIDH